MLRNKSFLVGLGSGLIAGAVMLQLMWKVDEMEIQTKASASPLTQQQLQSEAERLNLKVYTPQQVDDLKAKAIEEERVRLAKLATPAPTSAPATAPSPSPTATPSASPAAANIDVKAVTIPDRWDATSVANLLLEKRIILDTTKFIALLEEQKLSGKILPGTYAFVNSPDLAEVIKKITTLP